MKSAKKIKDELERMLQMLAFGSPSKFKVAKREIERLRHSDIKEFEKCAPLALEYIRRFDEIQSPKNQAAFASGLSLFFLALSDKYFDTLKNFVLKLIQNPDGYVRESIRKTADWLYVSLTSRVNPFVEKLTVKRKAEQKNAVKQYAKYVKEIQTLIEKYYDKNRDSADYVGDLKPSVYKSLELLWADVTRGDHIFLDDCPSENTLEKRKEIEKKLSAFVTETKSDFDVEDIRSAIYYEEGTDTMTDIIAMLDNGQGAVELQDIIDVITDAWNYFPHKTLGGKSPCQMTGK